MFIRYYVELPLPAARVEEALLGAPADWLPGAAGDAGERGERLLAQVGATPLGPRIAKQVSVSVGEPVRLPSRTSLPLVWEPAGGGALFPRMDADLEIGPLGPDRTQLALSGRYTPPLGPVGRAADRVLLHRVAEATVKDFLDRVAGRLLAAGAAGNGIAPRLGPPAGEPAGP